MLKHHAGTQYDSTSVMHSIICVLLAVQVCAQVSDEGAAGAGGQECHQHRGGDRDGAQEGQCQDLHHRGGMELLCASIVHLVSI